MCSRNGISRIQFHDLMNCLMPKATNDNNIRAFFELLKAGLWEKEAWLKHLDKINYHKVYQLAGEQTVIGIIAAGLEHVQDVKIPQEMVLTFVGEALQLEQRNMAMNNFIAGLVTNMREADIYTLLVKGQGVAQCYERPLWRSCGDVDFYLSMDNYEKAKEILNPLASRIGKEDKRRLHYDITIDSWLVELHGSMYTELSKRMNRVLDEVHHEIFYNGNIRSWNNEGVQVFLPGKDNDVVIIFMHFINHFYGEGIGLRQICDWCRLLWTYKNTLNYKVLESRIRKAGLMTEWRVFATFAVDYLGMPPEAMPLYDTDVKYSKKAEKLAALIIETGSIRANCDMSYRSHEPKWKSYFITFWKRFEEFRHIARIFPVNSPKFFVTYAFNRFKAVV